MKIQKNQKKTSDSKNPNLCLIRSSKRVNYYRKKLIITPINPNKKNQLMKPTKSQSIKIQRKISPPFILNQISIISSIRNNLIPHCIWILIRKSKVNGITTLIILIWIEVSANFIPPWLNHPALFCSLWIKRNIWEYQSIKWRYWVRKVNVKN